MTQKSLLARLSTWPPPKTPRLVGEGVSWTICIAYAFLEVFDVFGEQVQTYLGDGAVAILAIVLFWSRLQVFRTQQQSPEVDQQLREQLDGIRDSVVDLAEMIAADPAARAAAALPRRCSECALVEGVGHWSAEHPGSQRKIDNCGPMGKEVLTDPNRTGSEARPPWCPLTAEAAPQGKLQDSEHSDLAAKARARGDLRPYFQPE